MRPREIAPTGGTFSSEIRQLESSTLPRRLRIPIARCAGTAWHLLGSREPACQPGDGIHRLSGGRRAKRVPPAIPPLPGMRPPVFTAHTLAARATYAARRTIRRNFHENSVLCTLPDSPGNQQKDSVYMCIPARANCADTRGWMAATVDQCLA